MLMLLPFHFSDAPRKVWSELLVWSSPKHFLLWIHGGCCSSLIEAKQGRPSRLRSERLMIIMWANTPTATLNKRKHSGFTANSIKSANMQMCSQICVMTSCAVSTCEWTDIPPLESVGRLCCWDLSRLGWRPHRWRSCSRHCPLLTPWSCPPAPPWCSWICTAGCCSAGVQQHHLRKHMETQLVSQHERRPMLRMTATHFLTRTIAF